MFLHVVIIVVGLEFFCVWGPDPLPVFYTASCFWGVDFLDLDKVFLIGGKQQHSWLLLMLQFDKEALGSGHALITGSFGQKLSSPHHVRPLTKVLGNHITYRMVASSTCSFLARDPYEHRLPGIFIHTTDKWRYLDTAIPLTKSFPVWNVCCIKPEAFNMLFTFKKLDRTSFKKEVISKSECSPTNDTMTACLLISTVSLCSDMFTCNRRWFVTMMSIVVFHL